MSVRAAVSERFVGIDRGSSIRLRVEQEQGGRLVVTMRMERWQASATGDQRTVGAQLEVPPNRLHELAEALNGVARSLGIRP
ncbi:MAG TPA: hypothetical protein VJT32_11865 [bacterium]|nr:hypothetical protein [bacterium]